MDADGRAVEAGADPTDPVGASLRPEDTGALRDVRPVDPAHLAQAVGVDDARYGHRLDQVQLALAEGSAVSDRDLVVTGRVGVSAAADWPLRFYVAGCSGVSAPSARPSAPESE